MEFKNIHQKLSQMLLLSYSGIISEQAVLNCQGLWQSSPDMQRALEGPQYCPVRDLTEIAHFPLWMVLTSPLEAFREVFPGLLLVAP